jgi:gluconokinase
MAPSRSRSPSRLVLAIDIGTSSVRTALFDAKGRLRRGSKTSRGYQVRHSANHGAELDPDELLRAARYCFRQTQSSLDKHERVVVAGSGFWHSLLGIDRAGDPLTPVYTWGDGRASREAAQLRKEFDEFTIQQRTGCMLRASFWPAKLVWLRRTQAKLFRRVTRWVSPAEWIFEKLFGVQGCSHSMASGTGLYHFMRRGWDDELLARVGLTPAQLGPLRDRIGRQESEIFPAIGDGAAGNLGSGATAARVVAINVGTSAAVRALAPDDTPLPFGLFRYRADEKRSLLGGAISNAGNLRAWCLRELRLPDHQRRIENLLRAPGSSENASLTILPFWVDERAPSWPENLAGTIVGLNQTTTAADLLRAAVGASFLRLAEILQKLEGAIGRSRKMVVSGGILQSAASLQLLADSLGRDLEVCADQEASLRGAAIHALAGLGLAAAPPQFRRPVRHNKKRAVQLRRQLNRQQALEARLSDWRW